MERNYSITEREALAAKEALIKFQPFTEGEEILLVTDHSALQWARTYENTNCRLAAWGAVFSAYAPGLEIIHRPGRIHSNVDLLSKLEQETLLHHSPKIDELPAIALITEETPAKERARRVGEKEMRIAMCSQTRMAGGEDTQKKQEPMEERTLRNRATLTILDENWAKDLKKGCIKDSILRKIQEEDKIPKMPGGKPYAGAWFI